MKQNTSFKKITLILAAILVFVVVFAVGKPREDYSEEEPRDSDANYQSTDNVTNIVSEAVTQDLPEPPAGFPLIPVHPQAILLNSTLETPNFEAKWYVHQPLELVIAWYIDNLPQFGWMITAMPEDPASLTYQSATATKDTLNLVLSALQEDDDDPTTITIEISP